MTDLNLKLPETLHQELLNLANQEGVSLNQYIIYALTRQVTNNYNVVVAKQVELERQQEYFTELKSQLGKADQQKVTEVLSKREVVEPESELTPDIVEILREKIENKKRLVDN